MFWVGVVVIFSGVFVITSGRKEEHQKRDEMVQKGKSILKKRMKQFLKHRAYTDGHHTKMRIKV